MTFAYCGFHIARRLSVNSERESYRYSPFAIVITLIYLRAAMKLVDIRSNVVATISQYFANILFIAAIVLAISNSSVRRWFWMTVCATLWMYLYVESITVWPYSYWLGPAPYIYEYHASVSSSWVTAHCLFAILLSIYCGFVAQWIYGWFARRPVENTPGRHNNRSA
jgi:hypothetical protein